MTVTIKQNIDHLKILSTEKLMEEANKLVGYERENTVALITLLGELSSRNAFYDYGYNSLFKYCVEKLKIEPGQAYLRMQVAKVCHKYSGILEALGTGDLSLTAAAKLSPILTDENVHDLLELCRGKSSREIEEIVVKINPKKVLTSGIRQLKSKENLFDQGEKDFISSAEKPLFKAPSGSKKIQVANVDKFNFRFAANKNFKEKVKRLAEVLNIENMEENLAEILDLAVEVALNKKDPKRKQQRREKREDKKIENENSEKSQIKNTLDNLTKKKSRYISSSARGQLLKRSAYQCEKIGVGGVRCSAKTNLEIDHIVPFGSNGSNSIDNLQVLCSAHNLQKARQQYGNEYIYRKINDFGSAKP